MQQHLVMLLHVTGLPAVCLSVCLSVVLNLWPAYSLWLVCGFYLPDDEVGGLSGGLLTAPVE